MPKNGDVSDGLDALASLALGRIQEWALHWIWFAPKYRRMGLLLARWADFLESYGNFHIERPVSDAMQSFLRKHGTVEQRAWPPTQ